jgi:hypothetical protein
MAMKKAKPKAMGSDRGAQAKAKNASFRSQKQKALQRPSKPSNDLAGTSRRGNVEGSMPGRTDWVKGPGAWTGRTTQRAKDQEARKKAKNATKPLYKNK